MLFAVAELLVSPVLYKCVRVISKLDADMKFHIEPYNFAADSIHTKKLRSRLSS